jgi:hypothetical protein
MSVLIGMANGLAAAPLAALAADVLPTDAAGVMALEPSRDANMLTLAGTIPGTFLPMVLGWVASSATSGTSGGAAYRLFWGISAAVTLRSAGFLRPAAQRR